MRDKRGILEILLGVAVLGMGVVGTSVWYAYHNFHQAHRIIMLADFDSVEGLREGTPVKISGVVVGSVRGIQLDKESYSALVSFSVDGTVPLPRDTVAAIVSESLLGGKILSLIPGSDEECLSPGETISLTQSSVNLEGLIQKVIFNVDGDRADKPDGEAPPKSKSLDFSVISGKEETSKTCEGHVSPPKGVKPRKT